MTTGRHPRCKPAALTHLQYPSSLPPATDLCETISNYTIKIHFPGLSSLSELLNSISRFDHLIQGVGCGLKCNGRSLEYDFLAECGMWHLMVRVGVESNRNQHKALIGIPQAVLSALATMV